MHLVTFERREGNDSSDSELPDRSSSMGDAALGFEALEEARFGARRLGAVLVSLIASNAAGFPR